MALAYVRFGDPLSWPPLDTASPPTTLVGPAIVQPLQFSALPEVELEAAQQFEFGNVPPLSTRKALAAFDQKNAIMVSRFDEKSQRRQCLMLGPSLPALREALRSAAVPAAAERGCVPDRTRTCDPQFRKLLLYPTELRGRRQAAYSSGALFATRVKLMVA